MNHGGQATTLTAPRPDAQAEVIETAWREAGAAPGAAGYVETHGTGTKLGDPVEISGLVEAFRRLEEVPGAVRPAVPRCGLGSVKSNLGHLEGAAGLAGLIKILLSLRHERIPRTLHFERLNPEIDLSASPFHVVAQNEPWPRLRDREGRELPRRAGVSSFGFGGANAHVVIEEAPPLADRAAAAEGPCLVPLSARSENELIERARGLLAFLERLGPEKAEGAAGSSPDGIVTSLGDLLRRRFDVGVEPTPGLEWEELGWGAVETRLFLAAVEEAHGLRLPSRSLLESPSLESLAERIARERGGSPTPGQSTDSANIADIAWALQVGREPMAERAAFVVATRQELAAELRSFVAGTAGTPRRHRGFAGTGQGAPRAGAGLPELASLWAGGADVDWERLAPSPRPRRVHLPTYPFARARHWVSAETAPARGASASHPLLNGRHSFPEVRFDTVLTGDEPFLADHVVAGRPMLPGVAWLEMARAAVERVAGLSAADGETAVWLERVSWLRPLVVAGEPVRATLRLIPEDGGALDFELLSDEAGEAVFHGQGRAGIGAPTEAPPVDVAALRARCTSARFTADDLYPAFAAMGYAYGPALQGLEELFVGTDEILARLRLPDFLAETREEMVLHPSLADAAVQAILGFSLAERSGVAGATFPALPFELERAEILRPCPPALWAAIRREGSACDVDLCDDAGRVCARFRGLILRAAAPRPDADPLAGELFLLPLWEPVAAEAGKPSAGPLVIAGGTPEQQAALREIHPDAVLLGPGDGIEALGEVRHLVWIVPPHQPASAADDSILAAQADGVLSGFRLIKALLAAGSGDRPLTWTVITAGTAAVHSQEIASPTHGGVHGLIGTLAREQPGWAVRLLDLPSAGAWPAWREILAFPPDPHGNPAAWRAGRWYRPRLVRYRPAGEPAAAYRPDGVYVVIGGAGGIGEAWSEALLRRGPARLVWVGRRPLDASIQARLDRLAALGPAPLYLSADATDREQLARVRAAVLEAYGRIDGLIHAAIVLQDRSLENMTEDELRTGLAPKVDASVRLAQVFGGDALDFVLFFSSMLAFLKSPGQSNYVAGCTFKDAFARRLAAEWPCRVRVINWGYWGSVGAASSERHRELMARKGFGSIELPGAMAALDRLLGGPAAQLAYIETTGAAALEGTGVLPDEWAAHQDETLPSLLRDPGAARRLAAGEPWRPAPAWSRANEEIDGALRELLGAQLRSLGTAVPLDRYERWLERSAAELARTRTGNGAPLDAAAAWRSWELCSAAWRQDPDWRAHVELAGTALRALPEVLTGRRAPTDVLLGDLFDGGSTSRVGDVYRQGPLARFCNQTLADVVVGCIEERRRRDPAARLRILEIGAGTGATTEAVLAALALWENAVEEYVFTDISAAFLTLAKTALPLCPSYLGYATFDVERPPEEQGIAADRYDLVIATNVLHATKDIRRTLRHAKSVLRTNGLLLLNEIADNSLFHHLTFGLLDGWWLFADPELRAPGGPALRPETWKAVLEQEGFRSVLFPAAGTHADGWQVVVAESDGFVRRRIAPAAPPPREARSPAEPLLPAPGRPSRPETAPDRSAEGIAATMCQPREAATGQLLTLLRFMAAETLGVDPASLDARSRPFADALLGEFGMDSLSSNSLRNALRRDLGVDLAVHRIIADKVRFLAGELYAQLLLRHVSHDTRPAGEETEIFVF